MMQKAFVFIFISFILLNINSILSQIQTINSFNSSFGKNFFISYYNWTFQQADILYNFYQIMTDTIYNDLKQQGLLLSEGIEIGFPPIRAPKPSLIGQIASYVIPETKFENQSYQLIIVPILSNCFLVGRCNTLLCYKYQIDKEGAKPLISKPNINNLRIKIQKIHICDNKYLNDRGQIPFVIQSHNQLTLYYVDLKQNKIVQRNSLAFAKTLSVRFICEKQFLVMSNTHQIHHIIIQSGKMKQKSVIPANLKIDQTQDLKQVDILGNIDQEQQSTICLFYFSKSNQKDKQNSQILKVKQYQRDLDGKITAKNDYIILNTVNSTVLTDNYIISNFDNYFCILVKHQILILKKKFDRYLFIDNIMQKIGGNTLKLHSNGLVTSHSGNSMEINVIIFNDPKCTSKLLDNIQIPSQISDGFIVTWPFKNQKQTSLIFVFRKDKRLVFYNLRKMDPNQKMLLVVQNTPKQKITVVQQIAVNLGINKKDFYLNQWAHSKRQLPDVYQFLLPCWDIQSIKKQLRMMMRRKKIQVSELLKILQKLGKIIKNELKTNLSQNVLKQYIKNDFLLRKIKLKQASKRMDHRQMEKVYNSSLIDLFVQIVRNKLYPSQKQLDPLHAMVQAQALQQTNLKHVFQQFRMMILEDYKIFLISFISNFTPDQIVNVIQNYHYLLPTHQFKPNLRIHEPDYMTQVQVNNQILKLAKTQEQWFSQMTAIQFARQMSKQRIQKQLHDYYPNSKINQAINALITSQYGKKYKLHKHGLISCTMVQYKEKLKDIEDIKLFLKICEHVNQYNLVEDDSQDLSMQLVQIFKKKNKLEGKAYQTVRLYTSMHRFMIKNNFCQKKPITAQQLIQLTPQDLVALFFLQNRQRKQFIFKQFRNLFVNLYGNPNQFNVVINKFINSQNCSRIQLQIFINEIKDKGKQFQIQNQDLIELIIDGFCKKLEVRQDSDTLRFLQIMEEIQLSKKLAMKINKIYQVRICLNIFNIFNCQKQSYFNILKYQQNNYIFQLLLQKYFNGQMKKDQIVIQEQVISLDYCRNMLTVLLYLQQIIYYQVTQRQLLLKYCQVLIEWKQFEVIKGIIYDQQVLEKLSIDRENFINDLVLMCLDHIYSEYQIVYDPQTKEHIRSILDIYQGQNQIKTQQFAKLELVEIFESWSTTVHCNDIYLIINQWVGQGKTQFIQDLVNQYIEFLNFAVFQQIYRYMEMASGRPSDQIDIQNDQFVQFSLYYADRLLQKKKYPEIIKILAFVKSLDIDVDYGLISQTFLKSLVQKYSKQEECEQGKQAIQYFAQYFKDPSEDKKKSISQVFESQLDSARFEYKSIEREPVIPVNSGFCFRKQSVSIQIDILWDLATAMYNEKDKNIEILYYSYYFLLMIFRYPDLGFQKNHKISYSLESLTDILFKLEAKVDQNSDIWAINTYSIFKKFLKGLYYQAAKRIQLGVFKQLRNDKADTQAQMDMIKTKLREDKQKNSQLLKCITRVETYLGQFKLLKKTERQIRFQKSKQIKQEVVVEQTPQIQVEQQIDNDNGITLNLSKFKQRKRALINQSQISGYLMSEKQLLERIYAQEIQQKQKNRYRPNNPNKQGGNFYLPILNATTKKSTLQAIQKLVYEQQWDKLLEFSRDQLTQTMENFYHSPDKQFHHMVNALQQLHLLDDKKSSVLILAYTNLHDKFTLTSDQLKRLFPFAYLVEATEEDLDDFKQRIYLVMKSSFQPLTENKDAESLRQMAFWIGTILDSQTYIGRFCIDMLILLGKRKLESQIIVRISKLIHILRDYPHQVRAYLHNILDSFKQNNDLLLFIKQELIQILKYLKEEDTQRYIKDF